MLSRNLRGPTGSFGCARAAWLLVCCALSACTQELAASDDPSGAARAGCLEESAPLVGDEPGELGLSASSLSSFIDGMHSAELQWASGATTRVLIAASTSAVAEVRSRRDPDYNQARPAAQCSDYVRMAVRLELRSIDGGLLETIEQAYLTAHSLDEVRGTFEITRENIRGTHLPNWHGSHCRVALRVRTLFARDGTHGSLVDLLRAGSCGSEEGPIMLFSAGHWGARWLNY
jgi:hypothetical protein